MCFGKIAVFLAFEEERQVNADICHRTHHCGINLSRLYETLGLPIKVKPDTPENAKRWKAAVLLQALPHAFGIVFSARGQDLLRNAQRLARQIADERPQDEIEVQRLIEDLGLS